MSGEGWIGLAAVAITIVVSLVCATAWISGRLSKVSDRLSKLEGKLENGINGSLKALQKSVDTLGVRFDRAPCSTHAVQMADIERRLDKCEKRDE